MKIELSLNDAKVSAEGTLEEVQDVLMRFWLPTLEKAGDGHQATVKEQKKSSGLPKSKPHRKGTAVPSASNQETLDAAALANSIKSDPRFATIKEKSLDVPGKWLEKAKLVCLLAGGKVTSGDVKRVFDEFKIKTDLPTISKALSNNSTQFITSGTSPKEYEMTLATKESFEKWLFGNEGE